MSDTEHIGHCDLCSAEYDIGDQSSVHVCTGCERAVCTQCAPYQHGSTDCECKLCFSYMCRVCGATLDKTKTYMGDYLCANET